MRTQARIAFTVAALAALFSWLARSDAQAAGTGNVNLFGGVKQLDENLWNPLDSQSEYGLELSFGGAAWPVLIAVDYLRSSDEENQGDLRLKGTTQETAVGVRKIWAKGRARPYLGAGVDQIQVELEAEVPRVPASPGVNFFPQPGAGGGTATEDDSAIGLWAGAGIFWRIGPWMNLGLSARWSSATVTIRGEDEQAGGLHAGALLGFGWPAARP